MIATNTEIKLVAVDLDHTLLDGDLQVSERNRRALAEAAGRGVTVAIATGRTHASARKYALDLQIDAPIISYNGAMIREARADEPMRHLPLAGEIAAEIVELLVSRKTDVMYFLNDTVYAPRFDRWAYEYLHRTGDRAVIAGDLRKMAGESPTKILLLGTPEETQQRYAFFTENYGDRVYATVSLPEYMELLNPQATKASALRWLADHFEVPIEQTMALGDSLNDLEMVQAAGVGVYMAFADEGLRAQADFVPDSDRDGVAEAIEKLVLNETGDGG